MLGKSEGLKGAFLSSLSFTFVSSYQSLNRFRCFACPRSVSLWSPLRYDPYPSSPHPYPCRVWRSSSNISTKPPIRKSRLNWQNCMEQERFNQRCHIMKQILNDEYFTSYYWFFYNFMDEKWQDRYDLWTCNLINQLWSRSFELLHNYLYKIIIILISEIQFPADEKSKRLSIQQEKNRNSEIYFYHKDNKSTIEPKNLPMRIMRCNNVDIHG